MNPNKFYEYLLSGVKLFVLKNTLPDVEETINDIDLGLVVKSYSEVVFSIRGSILSNKMCKLLDMYQLSFSRYFKFMTSVINKEFLKIK